MKLIFERSVKDRSCYTPERLDVPHYALKTALRAEKAALAEVSELDLTRHYMELSKNSFGVDDGFYPLGSCTMKYNPKLNEKLCGLEGFLNLHPTQGEREAKGSMQMMNELQNSLCEITGMDNMTLQPAAGAHGEFCGIMLIKAYHKSRKDTKRTKIIVPDSAHGTNPASANMCGFEIVSVPSNSEGGVDIEKLKQVVGEDTAGLMLTNPNTLGLFDKNILEITKIIHEVGGLCYYDGANLNAIMSICRPGDMGFDVIHLNLHKTFSAPHGGGGPGCGPVGCKAFLTDFLPQPFVGKKQPKHSIGKVKTYYGNFLVMLRAYAYILTLGKDGLKNASELAVLNANYLKNKLQKLFKVAYDRTCMHEFVLDLSSFKEQTGFSALDVAKTMIDYKMHPPTMYFPLIVHEALMFEPTETESKEELDKAADVLEDIYNKAVSGELNLHNSPTTTKISRADEVKAARQTILKA